MKFLSGSCLSGVAGLVLGFFLLPVAALAGLQICNDTVDRQTVAIGYKADGNWVSEGWWNIDSGTCKTTIPGDLKSRYYYYLSKSDGWTFEDENIAFCTTSRVFTITGDQDCVGRGYDKGLFRKIDTGRTARQFTLNLAAFTYPDPAVPAAPPGQPQIAAPGTWGEPYYSATAIFQECVEETEAPFCAFHSDGYKLFVYDDGRTPWAVINAMRGYLAGTPIELSGDLEAVYDLNAEVVVRQVALRPWNAWDKILNQMQGQWYAVGDPASMFTVLGAEKINTYDGDYVAMEFLSMGNDCDGIQGGPFLRVTDAAINDALCYAIEEISDRAMTWMYLPRGNFHAFRRLD